MERPETASAARAIIHSILNGGTVELERHGDIVGAVAQASVEIFDRGEHDDTLATIDGLARNDAPGVAPTMNLAAARWGLMQLTCLALSLVDRRTDPIALETCLDGAWAAHQPSAVSPENAWSVDLSLRYLKDLRPQVRAFVSSDPARAFYEKLIHEWSLSRPAVDAGTADSSAPPWDHPSLARLSADRAETDTS